MRLCGLPPLIATSPSAAELARRLAAPRVRCLAGVPDAAKPALLAAPLVVTSAMALAQRTLAPAERQAATLTVRTGMRIARAELLARLLTLGYETVPLVEARGQVGHRGGIVDVFPPSAELPLRIELFGDEIESLR